MVILPKLWYCLDSNTCAPGLVLHKYVEYITFNQWEHFHACSGYAMEDIISMDFNDTRIINI